MRSNHLYELVCDFKAALVQARETGDFSGDIVFRKFPRGCCGDTCCLLAEYLLAHGIDTIYVCGSERDQSHAWLVIKDRRVKNPKTKHYELPEDIRDILNLYGSSDNDGSINTMHYEKRDLKNGLIVDITADQFGENPVLIEYMGDFHERFRFDFARDCGGIGDDPRLRKIYNIAMKYLSC